MQLRRQLNLLVLPFASVLIACAPIPGAHHVEVMAKQSTPQGTVEAAPKHHRPPKAAAVTSTLTRAQRQAFHRLILAIWYQKWLAGLAANTAYNEKACGGNLPPCYVCMRESHCTYTAFNAGGCGGRNCYGKWQWDPTTWDAQAKRMGRPDLIGHYFPAYPPDQDAVAAFTWDHGRGCSHWSACRG